MKIFFLNLAFNWHFFIFNNLAFLKLFLARFGHFRLFGAGNAEMTVKTVLSNMTPAMAWINIGLHKYKYVFVRLIVSVCVCLCVCATERA